MGKSQQAKSRPIQIILADAFRDTATADTSGKGRLYNNSRAQESPKTVEVCIALTKMSNTV